MGREQWKVKGGSTDLGCAVRVSWLRDWNKAQSGKRAVSLGFSTAQRSSVKQRDPRMNEFSHRASAGQKRGAFLKGDPGYHFSR